MCIYSLILCLNGILYLNQLPISVSFSSLDVLSVAGSAGLHTMAGCGELLFVSTSSTCPQCPYCPHLLSFLSSVTLTAPFFNQYMLLLFYVWVMMWVMSRTLNALHHSLQLILCLSFCCAVVKICNGCVSFHVCFRLPAVLDISVLPSVQLTTSR